MCQSSQLSGRVLPFLQSGRFSLPHIYKYITIYSFEENVAEPEGYDCSFHNAGKPENHSQKDKYQHPSVCDPLILYLSSSEKSRRHIWAYRLCDEAFSNTRHHLAYGGGGASRRINEIPRNHINYSPFSYFSFFKPKPNKKKLSSWSWQMAWTRSADISSRCLLTS